MKKTVVVLGSIFALWLGACSQLPGFTPTPGTGPTVDLFQTAVAQTLTAQPSSTAVPVTSTVTSVFATPLAPATDTPPEATFTLPPDLMTTTSTVTGVPTATLPPVNTTVTLPATQVTTIWTLAVRTYGTLPPLVPFSHITLINKAKAEAYISLHVDIPEGGNTVIEYPVKGTVKIEAPVGFYSYVAWVGGNKMVGSFKLRHGDDLTITLYRDRVAIK